MNNAISIKGLRKTYKGKKGAPGKEALKGIDLEVPAGSFFGLLGPNGAGKSTLINILAGLVIKDAGEVAVNGHDLDRESKAVRANIGVVPQELVVDTFFTVREALDIHAGYYGIPKAQRRTGEIIEALRLADKADANTRGLSGGMKRRLLVAKALVHSPPVLILDEPTAGVDVELRIQLWDYVKELNARGVTVLLTTHYLEEAQELCDRIAIINHGMLIANDSKSAMMKRLDEKQLIIKFTEALKESPGCMKGYETSVNAEGALVVKYRPSEAKVEEILSHVRGAGLTISDISTVEADLEDVFRYLVR